MKHPVNSGAADAVSLGDLAQAQAAATITEDGIAIELERMTSDVAAFEPGAPHAGAHPFDDEVALEFGDHADDGDDGAAQRPAGIDLLAEADELDVEVVELVEDLEEVFHRSGDAIGSPDQDDIEAAAAGIVHQIAESRASRLGSGDVVDVLVDDLEATLAGHLDQIAALGLGVLIEARDPEVESGAFHLRRPLGEFFAT